jgi:hypothetical protein
MDKWKAWAKAAGVRAVKTAAQTAVAMLPAAACITEVDWAWVIGTAALAAVTSLLTSLAGLPELEGGEE